MCEDRPTPLRVGVGGAGSCFDVERCKSLGGDLARLCPDSTLGVARAPVHRFSVKDSEVVLVPARHHSWGVVPEAHPCSGSGPSDWGMGSDHELGVRLRRDVPPRTGVKCGHSVDAKPTPSITGVLVCIESYYGPDLCLDSLGF